MTFHVGQKVVCVHAFVDEVRFPTLCIPVRGGIYTIRAIIQGHDGIRLRDGLLLEEITNGLGPRGIEYNFNPERFRPVVERKTDISVFTEMLADQKVAA